MVKRGFSEGASSVKSYIDVDELAADVFLRKESERKGTQLLGVRHVPSEKTVEDQAEGTEIEIVTFAAKAFIADKLMLQMDQISEVPSSLRTVNLEHGKRFRGFNRMHGLEYIFGIVLVTLKEPGSKNGEDIMQLFDDSNRRHRNSS